MWVCPVNLRERLNLIVPVARGRAAVVGWWGMGRAGRKYVRWIGPARLGLWPKYVRSIGTRRSFSGWRRLGRRSAVRGGRAKAPGRPVAPPLGVTRWDRTFGVADGSWAILGGRPAARASGPGTPGDGSAFEDVVIHLH